MANVTHYPVRNGAMCGKMPAPAHASQYDAENPTCEDCVKLRKGHERGSRIAHPELYADTASKPPPKGRE